MNKSIKLFYFIVISLISFLNAFSTPLNGTYTIGSGGDYATINSAYNDAFTQGIDGPVIFDIITGTYTEHILTAEIPGSSTINTVTFKSQSGNSADVLINPTGFDFSVFTSNSIFKELSIDISASNVIDIDGENISFINNNFNNKTLSINYHAQASDIHITGNVNVGNVRFSGSDFGFSNGPIYIINNVINGVIDLTYCSVKVEKNNIFGSIVGAYSHGSIIKNKISGYLSIDAQDFYNNFILGEVYLYGYSSNFIYNTVVGGSVLLPALSCYSSLNTVIKNNIVINSSGGTAFYSINNLNSDFNNFSNGGNVDLINRSGIMYNTVTEFYISTGYDQHSNSQPVVFQSPSDLHLAGTSVGDNLLAGIPVSLIPDDIDSQIRSLIHPYKGADEADFPLPVELTFFSSSVTENTVQLNWITSSEINNYGFDVERSNINSQWSGIGFIKGHGNSNTKQNYSFADRNLSPGKYNYRLKQIDFNGNFEYYNLSNVVVIDLPEKFTLSQNYPNPFNPVTNVEFGISKLGFVSLKVYDMLGKETATLVNEILSPGKYTVKFNGGNFASGVYFYRMESGEFKDIKRMVLIK
ncbi:MAG: T9SS type A sorting domain-containing protein [Ignavibacteria bacterium]|nr:T9SS type A sorting domain-containing protein [Ignavibacteria bacterium]